MKSVMVVLACVLSLTFSVSASQASELSRGEVTQKLTSLFAMADEGRASRTSIDDLTAVQVWSNGLVKKFDTNSRSEAAQTEAVIQAYLMNSFLSTIKMPRAIRDHQLASIWAELYFGKKGAAELRNKPVTFKILKMKSTSFLGLEAVRVTLQMVPEFTSPKSPSALVNFTFVKSEGTYKVADVDTTGIHFLKIYAEQVTTKGRNPQVLTRTLLSKGLVTQDQIEDYTRN